MLLKISEVDLSKWPEVGNQMWWQVRSVHESYSKGIVNELVILSRYTVKL